MGVGEGFEELDDFLALRKLLGALGLFIPLGGKGGVAVSFLEEFDFSFEHAGHLGVVDHFDGFEGHAGHGAHVIPGKNSVDVFAVGLSQLILFGSGVGQLCGGAKIPGG